MEGRERVRCLRLACGPAPNARSRTRQLRLRRGRLSAHRSAGGWRLPRPRDNRSALSVVTPLRQLQQRCAVSTGLCQSSTRQPIVRTARYSRLHASNESTTVASERRYRALRLRCRLTRSGHSVTVVPAARIGRPTVVATVGDDPIDPSDAPDRRICGTSELGVRSARSDVCQALRACARSADMCQADV